jgi:plastocyanin
MIRIALLALALLSPAVAGHAGDVGLTIDGTKFGTDTVKLKRGDRLVVANHSQESHFIWGHAGSYAFDFRSTDSNVATHKPGETHGITMNVPGRYHVGCALHQGMRATVIVEE